MNTTGKFVGIIPARYLSTRFPGKPLVDICGKSMICRVLDQCRLSKHLEDVYVATDDERIYEEVAKHGGKAIMTQSMLVNGTERCFDAYEHIAAHNREFQYLINIQGDEPFIHPEQIDELCMLIASSATPVATLVQTIETEAELWDENVVKAVIQLNGQAHYFSRSPVPFVRGVDKEKWFLKRSFLKHIGIYAFATAYIGQIRELKPTENEKSENLEQLRWLDYGVAIATHTTRFTSLAVDTPADLEKAIRFIQSND